MDVKTKKFMIPMLMAVAIGIVWASVFVYDPVNIGVEMVAPPISFAGGTNAGGTDLGGNTISVSVGANQTSMDLTVHPTYQKTYYKNVAEIHNNDASNAYYVWINVETPINLGVAGAEAEMIIKDTGGTTLMTVDLTTTGTTASYVTIPASGKLIIDLQFVYPEGNSLPGSLSGKVNVIYSPQNSESP